MAYPRYLVSRNMVKARRTSGNITLNGTAWANVDTGLDLTLKKVQAGDQLVYGISAFWQNEAIHGFLDVVTLVSGSPLNSFAVQGAVETTPGYKFGGWYGVASAYTAMTGTCPPYTVVAGDVVSGAVTLRLRGATLSAGNKVIRATTSEPFDVWAMNLGPAQT